MKTMAAIMCSKQRRLGVIDIGWYLIMTSPKVQGQRFLPFFCMKNIPADAGDVKPFYSVLLYVT